MDIVGMAKLDRVRMENGLESSAGRIWRCVFEDCDRRYWLNYCGLKKLNNQILDFDNFTQDEKQKLSRAILDPAEWQLAFLPYLNRETKLRAVN